MAFADASLLKRDFQNLMANAIRYTLHGTVLVGAREAGADGAVECWVSDDGAGIPEELLDHVFDKGEIASASDGGTGLGLAIVLTLTEAHGGKIAVESKEGQGSMFTFSLPAKVRT